MDSTSTSVTATSVGEADGAILSAYEIARRIRAFDDLAQKLISSAQAFFVHYPVRGHELISAAVGVSVRPSDYVTATYRGLGEEIAKGLPLRDLWAERLGKSTGTSKGRGGPMHISDPESGLMLMTGIVGGGLPIGVGLALSSDLRADERVTICNFGDGASNIGAFHEALNLAAVWALPIVFLCQNNLYGEHTRFTETQKNTRVAERASGYGMRGVTVDGTDLVATLAAVREAIDYARSGAGPVLLECVTFRTLGHVGGDQNEYMDPAELAWHREHDPLPGLRQWLIEGGHASEATLDDLDAAVEREVQEAYDLAKSDPPADTAKVLEDVYGSLASPVEIGESAAESAEMTMREAIHDALDVALSSDPAVILLGEDIADTAGGGVFGTTTGLSSRHGASRVRNTPIAEEAIIGAAIGAALAGMKPIAEIMMMDFLGVCFDQLVNHAAKLRYMSGGRTPVPMVVRVSMLGGSPIGAQHNQSNEALFMHSPGLKIIWPSTPYDAKGLLLAAIEDGDPCLFIETPALMRRRGQVPPGHYTIPLGKAAVRRNGTDLTIVSWGRMMTPVLTAAEELERDGIDAEVIDLRSLQPLDYETVLQSVGRTRRVVIVHEAVRTCGPGAEIASRIYEELYGELVAPVKRVTSPDGPIPGTADLVAAFYPSVADIVAACRSTCADTQTKAGRS
jgi:pyruvate/2-oxoglutarate/acetoin dehydrogenase E1 component/TPP-dependent pyruvate/acetoin dehydrogenase alpha subunit